MPEKDDAVVSIDDHNKVVAAHNSLKVEQDSLKKENEVLKQKIDQTETEKKESEEKAKWMEELKKRDEQISELKQKVEEKDSSQKVSKSIVSSPVQNEEVNVKQIIDKFLPDRPKNPENFGSNLQRYAYYKNGATKSYTNGQLGMGLSLHAGAQISDPNLTRTGRTRIDAPEIILKRH